MRHPSTITCDLCQNKIDTQHPWPRLDYPLPTDLRERIEADCTSRLGGEAVARVLPLMLAMSIPNTYNLDVCKACIDAILPQINETVRHRVIEFMRRRAETSVVEDDD